MRVLLISDIHANTEALHAVMTELEREPEIDRIVCLGDLVGYHAEPNECIELIDRVGATVIAGNHDLAAVGRMDESNFGAAARRSTRWTRKVLSNKNRQYLLELPLTHRLDESILLFHAALHPEPNAWLHLSTTRRVEKTIRALASGRHGARIGCFGHTHRPAVYELLRGRLTERLRGPRRGRIELSREGHYLINPGSVGQSRDSDDRAAYALLDTTRGYVDFRRVGYDLFACRTKARRAGLLDTAQPGLDRKRTRRYRERVKGWWKRLVDQP